MNGRSMLRDRSMAALMTAEVISGFGSWMTYLALPWFVLTTTGSPTRMGLVLGAELVPIAVLGIPSGEVVTRLGARTTMLIGDLGRVPIIAAIPLLHAAGALPFWLLLVLVAATGVFSGPYFSAQRLILPEIVGEDEGLVSRANSVVEGAQRFNQFAGPAAAGVLIAAVGASSVLYIDAATFLVSFVLVWAFVRRGARVEAAPDSGGAFAGLRYVTRDPFLGPTMIVVVTSNALGQAFVAGLPVLAYEEFGQSSRVAGAFYAAAGVGAVLGSVVAYRIATRYRPMRVAAIAVIAGVIPRWLLALRLPAPGVMGAIGAGSFWNPIGNAPMISLMTTRTPPALRAKVMTAVVTFAVLAGPLGLGLAGPVIEAVGVHVFFLLVAAGMTLSALYFAFVALRADRAELGAALAT
jgi:MFS family permease